MKSLNKFISAFINERDGSFICRSVTFGGADLSRLVGMYVLFLAREGPLNYRLSRHLLLGRGRR